MAYTPHHEAAKSQTRFLFVHHDSSNLDSRVNPQEVNAHVQVLYRRRKRGALERWEPNLTSRAKLLRLKMRDGVFVPHSRRRRKSATTCTLATGQQGISNTAAPAPLTHPFAIQKGNSDPFAAMPVLISPLVNMILAWHRDEGIPALNPVEAMLLASPTPSARRTWSHTIFSVQNGSLVHPYLASVCALMARRTAHKRLSEECLQFKDRGYLALRKTLNAPNVTADLITRNMILSMFWAELATGNPTAARTHLKMLSWLVKAEGIQVPSECRLRFLAADTNLAISQLTAPIADAKDRSVERHFEDWKLLLSWKTNAHIVVQVLGLHTVVTDQRLRTVFMQLREMVAITELVARREIQESSIFQWMDARLLSCESQLLALFLECFRSTSLSPSEPGPARWKSRPKPCVCLAALAWIGSTWASSNRDMGRTSLTRLRAAVRRSKLIDSETRGVSQELVLWILYVGALLEARNAESTEASSWFSDHFSLQSKHMGLHSPGDVTEVLKGFLFMEPFGDWSFPRQLRP